MDSRGFPQYDVLAEAPATWVPAIPFPQSRPRGPRHEAHPAAPGGHPAGGEATAAETTLSLYLDPGAAPVPTARRRTPAAGEPAVTWSARRACQRFPELAGLPGPAESWTFEYFPGRSHTLVGYLPLPGGMCTLYLSDSGEASLYASAHGRTATPVHGPVAEVVRRAQAAQGGSRQPAAAVPFRERRRHGRPRR